MTEAISHSSISGWQKRFPLPESLDNSEFRVWAHSLDEKSNTWLANDLIVWGKPLGIESEAPVEQRPLIAKLETFIGELVEARPGKKFNWFPGLNPRDRGGLIRISGGVLHDMDPQAFYRS